jgi:lambda family phage minor tail protein L
MIPPSVLTLDLDAIIPLYELTDYNLTDPTESIFFCNYVGVSFEDQEYQAIGCESEGIDYIGQGALDGGNLRVSNVGNIISDWLYQVKTTSGYRLEGATVKRTLTQRKYLDDGTDSGASLKSFAPDIFKIEQVSAETFQAVDFKLSTPWELDGYTLPGRSALRTCAWVYRGVECGYTGTQRYTITNTTTTDPKLDVCSKSIQSCETRFGTTVVLNHSGFPALGSFS